LKKPFLLFLVKLKETSMNVKTPRWWQFGYVWLVIAGPLCVVVASFATFYLAWSHPDPVLSEDYYQQGLNINQTPAMQARNHAATQK
jgi:hypothetical protein